MSIITVTNENFKEFVANAQKPILLDFWATWCGPCQMLSPVIHEIAEENDDIIVGKVNVDEQPELAGAFQIASIPTLVVIENGKIVNQMVGFSSKEAVLKLVKGK